MPASAGGLRAAMGAEGDLVDLRLGRGCRAFVGSAGGEVVAFGWLSSGAEWIGELDLEIRPPAGEAYLWNCFTLPAHRHGGYFRGLLGHVVAVARDEGLSRLWIGAVDGGAESAVTGTGFAPVLYFRAVTLDGVRWITVRASEDVDQTLLSTAMSALGGGHGPLRSGFRRVRRRRH
jgi:GNAT superfamily N-acetyltransferase